MVYDMDALTGGAGCNDVIFDNLSTSAKIGKYFEEVKVNFVGVNTLRIENLPQEKNSSTTQIAITDAMGRVIVHTQTRELSLSIHHLPLKKGVYFISFQSGKNFKTVKVIHYE